MRIHVLQMRRRLRRFSDRLFPPRGWGSDLLTSHVDTLLRNAQSTYRCHPGSLHRLIRLDGAFSGLITSLSASHVSLFPGSLVHRAHSAIIVGSTLASARLVPEAYAVLRSSLESALYAWHMDRDPAALAAWRDRFRDPTTCKKHFAYAPLRDALLLEQPATGKDLSRLYEWTIDMGAHPNIGGMLQGLLLPSESGFTRPATLYFAHRDRDLKICMNIAARIGLCDLDVLSVIYPRQVEKVGLLRRIEEIRKTIGDPRDG